MGEYAKYNGQSVKIGTCEEMLYLRFEDRHKVQPEEGSVDPAAYAHYFRFRLPYPDEDDVGPGGYENPFRGLRLYKPVKSDVHPRFDSHEDFTIEGAEPGRIQLRHEESGLLVSVACYHGQKLPEGNKDFKPFWNGKGYSAELASLRPDKDENGELRVFPVVRCRHCRKQWRCEWSEVVDYIEPAMLERLADYNGVRFAP